VIVDANPSVRLHVTEAPPGRLRYYPRREDPIRPNPFSTWTQRSLPIGMKKAADADGATVQAPDWNAHAERARDYSGFLNFSFACRVWPTQPVYEPGMVINPHPRPTHLPNLWVSAPTDFMEPEWISLSWDKPSAVSGVQILFDSALHFHFSQSWQGYAVRAIPSLVKDYRVVAMKKDAPPVVIADVEDNYQRNCNHVADLQGVTHLRLECLSTHGLDRAQVYAFRAFGGGEQV